MKENSPFTPGNPAPVELFVGRVEQIEEILKYVRQTSSGRQENVFLAGERGIGKSSLAAFLRHLVDRENFLAIHVFVGGVTDLEELVRRVFEQILKETNKQTWFGEISDFFGKYVKQVDLFGISVSFNPPQEDLEGLVRSFPEALKNIMEKIKNEKKGLFIVLDDINGISETPEFANWYKSFVDDVATHYTDFPAFIMPIGIPEIRDVLSEHQPSLMRIFRVVEIDKLSDDEVNEFFEKTFKKVNIEVESEAMGTMVGFSSGLPILMHEIGDAVFWRDDDGVISEEDTLPGIVDAADRIGKKYLDPKVYRTIRSKRYRSILRKLGEEPIDRFKKSEIESKLSEEEKKVFNNFLGKMRQLRIIVPDIEGGRGSYKFVNVLYPVYIWMESRNIKPKEIRKNKSGEV
ncbi:MAG TPA: ATP-binding protein [Methanosarcinales archaeon]|nr:ATP-binding protein [Methanosarcinales archaeon]